MRARSRALWFAAMGVYAFLYLPLLIVIVFSFNDSRLNARWTGFTLDWYEKLLGNQQLLTAAWNSFVIAVAVTLISVVIGTIAGIALSRYRARFLSFLVVTPMAVPDILTGVSLLVFFVMIHLTLGMQSVILAHVSFCISFVAIVVRSSLTSLDPAPGGGGPGPGRYPVGGFPESRTAGYHAGRRCGGPARLYDVYRRLRDHVLYCGSRDHDIAPSGLFHDQGQHHS